MEWQSTLIKSAAIAMVAIVASGDALGGGGTAVRASHPAVGDPARGRDLIIRVGCGACHRIPGVLEADGNVGPPLDQLGRRQYIAGVLHNTPDNLALWIRFPQSVMPGNAMPQLGVTKDDARDIVAYLETLR